ncbi:NAD(P)H-dependent oxidoreductase [Sinomicrobium sp. M5D2P17]
MKKVLIINAHQKWEGISEGKLNRTLTEQAISFFKGKGLNVLETVISEGYDVEEEVAKHTEADLVLLQTPIFWFNPPYTYKKYTDEVFMNGMLTRKIVWGDGRIDEQPDKQYGTGGQLPNRKFFVSASWNAPAYAFNDPNQVLLEGKSPEDVLFNVAMNYKFSGYDILPQFNCFDVVKNPQPEFYFEEYNKHLEKILTLSKSTQNSALPVRN